MTKIRYIARTEIIVEESIGGGAFSDVHRARWADDDNMKPREQLAVKIFRRLREEDDPRVIQKLQARLNKEVSAWSYVPNHRNVLPFIGVYPHDSERIQALVSSFRPAGDVMYYAKSHPNINRRELTIGIIAGLSHLHSNGIIHGDFSPNNVLVDIDSSGVIHPQIADFGRAKIVDAAGFDGSLISNIRYTSPEVLLGGVDTNKILSTHSDVWSLGMVLLSVLSGIEPYPEMKPPQIVLALNEKKTPDPEIHRMNDCPVRAKVWPLLESCWRIESPPAARCSADVCLSAFKQTSYGVSRLPLEGELEEALGDALREGLIVPNTGTVGSAQN